MAAVPLKVDASDDAAHDEKMMATASAFFKAEFEQQPSQVVETNSGIGTPAKDSFEELVVLGHRLFRRRCA